MNITYSTYDLDLPNPNFEDTRRFSTSGIKRRTPGGVLKLFKDSEWPVIETFIYTIYRLTEAQRDTFIALLNASSGLSVVITDHLGAVRPGFIVTPINEIITMRDGCWYDIHFEFLAGQITNIIGDCHTAPTIDTPELGDADYHQTISDEDFYRIYAEDDAKMYAEDDDDLWIEAY